MNRPPTKIMSVTVSSGRKEPSRIEQYASIGCEVAFTFDVTGQTPQEVGETTRLMQDFANNAVAHALRKAHKKEESDA